ncbi:MAG TPA: glycosyltransferase family 4 protein [Candidatus Saccharimonadales bacterium]|nr:glycosyltransferase family 4 protein [Candidatus Saccharimonadales bacterium]
MASKKLKILVLSHISELLGGAERSMMDTFDYWAAHYDIEPEFIMRQPIKSLAGELDSRGWKYHALNYTFWSDANPAEKPEDIFRSSVTNSRAIREIEEIIKTSKPDIVATNTVICPWAALAAHFQNTPHIWFVREYGDLDHGRTFEIGHEQTFRDIGNLSNFVVCNSETLATHAKQFIDKDKLRVLYNPFDLERIAERVSEKVADPFKSKTSLKIILASNIARTKGQLEAVKATGILKKKGYDIELCLLGRGDQDVTEEIKLAAKQDGVEDRVHLTGLVPNALAYVGLADVGIIASRKEAFGRATFEYLAASKAVVGANSGATPEMVSDGVNGFLFEAGSVDSLARAIENYAKDKSLAARHGQAGLVRAKEMMSGPNNADNLFQLVQKVGAGQGPVKPAAINFTHRWLDYIENADRFIKQSGEVSLRRLVRLRARQKAKGAYYRARTAKAKLTGK